MTKPSPTFRRIATRLASALVLASAALVALYALFLLVVGQPWTVLHEGGTRSYTQLVPAPQAIIPLLAALTILAAFISRRTALAWVGVVALLAFSALFLFGIGGGLLPLAALMLVLMFAIRFLR